MMSPLRSRLAWLWLLLLAGLLPAQAQLVINEFLASNNRNLADRDGEFSDWIELRNTGTTVLNLAGWTLTDDPNQPTRWTLPATNLSAGAYLLVFASGKDRAVAGAELHANFSLNAGGEYLALFAPEANQPASEFAPEYPAQQTDISYGVSDGQLRFFNPPTPRSANGAGFADFVADTKFSHDRGFYDQAFDLIITCATPGATIRYTTNGAPPTATTGVIYSDPLSISTTQVIRAAAFKAGLQPSGVDTQTYLFPAEIFKQSANGQAPPGWPTSWGNNVVDYGMDPDVVNSATYRNELRQALFALPSFVLVTDLKHLFDPATGVYSNPGNDGREWERPASVELIRPDGEEGFQVNCGVRIRGGFSRSGDNPKHALRLFFRQEYGDAKLRYPLFGNDGADTFDAIDLRTFQNYSWSFQGDNRGVFFRDQFSRDAQLDLGHQAERGDYYHLFINGQYWGIYNTCERPEASYGETYFGGNKEDFDVIKVEAGPYEINATDGNLSAWNSLYSALRTTPVTTETYLRLQGLNPDGTVNPSYPPLIDVDNLIDYQLVIFFGGNLDAPISWFLGENSPNNFYGMRDRTGRSGGFKFFAHDAEHTLLNVDENRTGPFPAGSSSVNKSNPQYFFQRLATNPEFRLRVADRAQRAFANNGPLTPAANRARVARRTNEIYSAVVLESARWGDSKRSTPFTRNTEWLTEVNRIQSSYFSQRTTTVLNQLRTQGWYPSVGAPTFSQFGGPFATGAQLALSGGGTIYFTTDGTDPRLPGGEVAPGARTYVLPVTLTENTTVKARVRSGTTWSALTAADFQLIQTWTDVAVTELMYHPPDLGAVNGDDLEFLELKNVGSEERDLGGLSFTNGIRYTFPAGTRLAPGKMLVLASQEAAFTNRYPGVKPFGIYAGKLANGGERLTLIHAAGAVLMDFAWSDEAPWPTAADGDGFSLVWRDPNRNPNPNEAGTWRASAQLGGSPGLDDPNSQVAPVVVNEVLAHTDLPAVDSIELFNPTAEPVSVAGWYLTDDRSVPKKFRIPAGVTIPAGGYGVVTELQFNEAGAALPFALSSHGDEVYLFSADAAGNLTGHSDGFGFGASANGVSFGRYTNSVGEVQFPAQLAVTLGTVNSGPRVGPLVINEFSYRPSSGDVEFVEVKNISGSPLLLFDPLVPTNRWRVGGFDVVFPEGAQLPPNGLAVVTAGDPSLFRQRWSIPDSVPVWGPAVGNLNDTGERLELLRPDSPDTVTNQGQVTVIIPEVAVESVRYAAQLPWPGIGTSGASLERIRPDQYGDDPVQWRAATAGPSPGLENSVNRAPRVFAGEDQQSVVDRYPHQVSLLASATDDGQPGGALQYQWTQVDGPTGVVFTTPQSAATGAQMPGQGLYRLRVTVSDGERSATDDVLIQSSRSTGEATFVSAGSVWRYVDSGQDLGTAWRAPDFNDSGWKSGRAQLGYGDGDEVTVIGFGPDGNNKYITTYFRLAFDLSDVAGITELTLRLMRDDGAVVYLNGTEVSRSNLPETTIGFRTPAINAAGGADESNFFEFPIDRGALREGRNVLAVELHQNAGTSSDTSFDLALVGRRLPGNVGPTADAGVDRTVAAGAWTLMSGLFTEDGLPLPPGAPVFAWSQVSGPASATLTQAATPQARVWFSTPGDYVFRFVVRDGLLEAADEVRFTVTPDLSVPPAVVLVQNPPGFRFTTEEGRSYSVVWRAHLESGNWTKERDVPAGTGGRVIDLTYDLTDPQRFYQVVSPALP